MKNIIFLSALAFIAVSCNKSNVKEGSSPYGSSQSETFLVEPTPNNMVEKTILSETNFIDRICESVRHSQEQLGRDMFDFSITEMHLVIAASSAIGDQEASDPIDNYINQVSLYFDKNDGSSPIQIATSNSANTSMSIVQSDLLNLALNHPNFEMYYVVEFNQSPGEGRTLSVDTRIEMKTKFKYTE